MRTVFIRALDVEDKGALIRALVGKHGAPPTTNRHEVDMSDFSVLPKSVFAYWIGPAIRGLFQSVPPFAREGQLARVGLQTNDDFQWIRHWWESLTPGEAGLAPAAYAKGGAFARYYSDLYLTVLWGADGRRIKDWKADQLAQGRITANNSQCWNESHYLRGGITWSQRADGLSLRAMPRGSIFGNKGPGAFVPDDAPFRLLALLALMNSAMFKALIDAQLARTELAQSFDVGMIERTPVPDLTPADEAALASLARRAWSLKRSLDTRTETSHAFVLPALLQVPGDTLAARAAAWAARVRATEDELAAIQVEIDERCFELYGISGEDRRSITEGFGGSPAGSDDGIADDVGADDEEEAEADTADTATLAAELVSWAVGVAFGRFDVRLATGDREVPGEPEPFDPLPVCSPAMLTGADGLPLEAPPAGYPLSFPSDGVLVDDPGHSRDLATAVRAVFDTVFGSRADAAWQEAGDLLDPRGHDVAAWLRSGFFEHHLGRHSKSRRKAPIVWQLGSGRSGIFAYAHRLTRDSLFAIANEIAGPRLAAEERKLASLRTQAGASPSARDRAEIDAAEAAVEEARTVVAEVRRVGPLWNPDLDDGIVLVSAPLWRLVPYKAWQKELKGRWEEIAVGKYDWAHLAMHLWPERVVPKCASDRSLAIAHGLEHVFWAEGPDGKWAKRGRPARPVDELVAERTSPAVKAALADLQGALALAGTGRRRGRS